MRKLRLPCYILPGGTSHWLKVRGIGAEVGVISPWREPEAKVSGSFMDSGVRGRVRSKKYRILSQNGKVSSSFPLLPGIKSTFLTENKGAQARNTSVGTRLHSDWLHRKSGGGLYPLHDAPPGKPLYCLWLV